MKKLICIKEIGTYKVNDIVSYSEIEGWLSDIEDRIFYEDMIQHEKNLLELFNSGFDILNDFNGIENWPNMSEWNGYYDIQNSFETLNKNKFVN